jgi:hypothetical protein
MAQCIGFRNQKYFVLFATYMFIACVVVAGFSANALSRGELDRSSKSQVVMTMIFTGIFSIVFAGFSSFQFYLVVTNQTSYELSINTVSRMRARRQGSEWANPYDEGWHRNLVALFGSSNPFVLTLPSLSMPRGDGIDWETFDRNTSGDDDKKNERDGDHPSDNGGSGSNNNGVFGSSHSAGSRNAAGLQTVIET